MTGLRIATAAGALALMSAVQPVAAHEEEAASAPISTAEMEELAALMLASFATAFDSTDQTIIDRRIAVTIDGEEGIWFYSQMNTGDDQWLYRQRFHRLTLSDDSASVVQRSFTPVDADRFADGWDSPDAFAELTSADLQPALNDGCTQHWTRDAEGVWRGVVDPQTCAIFSERRQVTIRIGADSYYRGTEYGTSERGFDEAMNPIWGSAPGDYIPLTRCRTHLCALESQTLAERAD